MTIDERDEEWNYRYQERLGILCGAADPTPEQDALARGEADQIVGQLETQETT